MKLNEIRILTFIFGACLWAQLTQAQVITGKVTEAGTNGNKSPIAGASVFWINTTTGTTTDSAGMFKLSTASIRDMRLVVRLLGYKTDTIAVRGLSFVDVKLLPSTSQLGAVEIEGRIGSTFISELDPRKVQTITSHELRRAACCNLAESFETSASVDVNYADALTGARQIQLLGLSGVYSQIITENVPLVRGLGSSFGMGYIPGSWMESIQLSKGASSVVNGFESTTGQINVELKKPASSEKLFVNVYGNQRGRAEFNVNAATKLNEHLSTMVLGHFSRFANPVDANKDLFMDQPKVTSLNLMNRWDYMIPDRYVSRFGIKFLDEKRIGGFVNFNPDTYKQDTSGINDDTKSYGMNMHTQRLESFWKNGIMFKDKPDKSLALIVSGIYHKQDGYFGLNDYNATQKSFYANLLYQNDIGNPHHKFTTGLSFMYDNYLEAYKRTDFTYGTDSLLFVIQSYMDTTFTMDRKEIVPGAFFEYTYTWKEKLTLIGGIRADHHNTFGTFITPRFHLRYKITPTTTFRASIGKGFRTANIFAENYSIMASQRKINFVDTPKQEEAVNMGLNLTQDFKLFSRDAQLDLEAYRTQFINQVIVDLDSMPAAVFICNLDGKSYSNILQLQLTMEPVKRFNVLAAFRINDVHVTENGKLREKAMVNAYKGLVTVSYATKFGKWRFDLTSQFNGKARIPDTEKMPLKLQRAGYSPAYVQMLAQVTRHFKVVDIYLGGENLTGFTQTDPVTEYWKPYHTHFDTSMAWGPIVGTTIYAGLRLTIK